MPDSKTLVRAALREFAGKPLRRYLAERPNSALIPADMDFSMTADHLVDDPREPIITPLGVLDHRGMMLVRVRLPIKVAMGFHKAWTNDEPDEVEAILPEDMLSVSDIGAGVDHVDPGEVEGDEDEGEDGGSTVNLSEVLKALHSQGIQVNVDVEFVDAEAPEGPTDG